MTQGPILRLILTFSIPLLLGNLFQELYLVVDSIIVGNFCDANELAAVGSAESPSKVMLAMFRGLSVATTVLVSQAVGRTGKAGEDHGDVQYVSDRLRGADLHCRSVSCKTDSDSNACGRGRGNGICCGIYGNFDAWNPSDDGV